MESVLMKNWEGLLKKSSQMISKEATTIPQVTLELLFTDQPHQKMLLYDTRLFLKNYIISGFRMILSPLEFPPLFPTFICEEKRRI